jgi:hypothetical protein
MGLYASKEGSTLTGELEAAGTVPSGGNSVLQIAVAALLIGCVGGDTDKPPQLDSGRGVDTSLSEETDAEDDTAQDTGFDTSDPIVYSSLEEGFESALTEWVVLFEDEWGYRWGLNGTNEAGDIVVSAGQLSGFHSPNTTVSAEIDGDVSPLYVIIDHRAGVDCWLACDACAYWIVTYRATAGEIELSLWEDHAEFRLTNLVFEAEDGGEGVWVPLIEAADVPYDVCPDDSTTW